MLRAEALLNLGETMECAKVIAACCLRNPHWQACLPIEACADALDLLPRTVRGQSLAVPVVFDLLQNHSTGQSESRTYYAYEDYLTSQGIQRPSQLALESLPADELALATYFFRHVCIEAVMDQSVHFDGSRMLADERLAVCRLLTHLDPERTSQYHNEIKQITRASKLTHRIKQIELSKIFVDLESLRRRLDLEARETYERFLGIARERPGNLSIKGQTRIDLSAARLSGLDIPGDRAPDIFLHLVSTIRDEFATSPDHGLDKYLSVRIRHGTLAARLRGPLERAKIITRKLAGKGYVPNTAWRLAFGASAEDQTWIEARLQKLAQAFDQLIDDVTARLRVSTTREERGLFQFVIYGPWLEELELRAIEKSLSFESVVEEVVLRLNGNLESALDRVRHQFATEVKQKALGLLDGLILDVEDASLSGDSGGLVNAVRVARGELSIAIDRIVEWFRLSTNVGNEQFPFDEVVEMGREGVRVLEPNFRVEISQTGDESVSFPGRFVMTIRTQVTRFT
jgi:hypothetical protein